jgi:polar amino acid transport system substrate-binding protein
MRLVGLVAVALTLAACATPEVAVPPRKTPSVPTPEPTGVQWSPEIPPDDSHECRPEESLAPLGPLPPPGRMPDGSTMAAVQRRKLIVGIGANAYLLGFRDSRDGQVRGFEAGIAEEVAFAIFGGDRKKIAERIQYRELNLADRIPALVGEKNDKGEEVEPVDLVIAAMTMTCERWQKVAFSTAYYPSKQRLLVNHNSGVESIDDLGGKRVCASAGSTNLRPIAQARSNPIPVAAANTSDCLTLLQQGQVDAVSTGDIILAGLKAQDPTTVIVGPSLREGLPGIAMSPKTEDLVRFVNGVLEKMIADGTWKGLQRTWLSEHIGTAEPPVPRYRSQ